jgi:hypothetical protein
LAHITTGARYRGEVVAQLDTLEVFSIDRDARYILKIPSDGNTNLEENLHLQDLFHITSADRSRLQKGPEGRLDLKARTCVNSDITTTFKRRIQCNAVVLSLSALMFQLQVRRPVQRGSFPEYFQGSATAPHY